MQTQYTVFLSHTHLVPEKMNSNKFNDVLLKEAYYKRTIKLITAEIVHTRGNENKNGFLKIIREKNCENPYVKNAACNPGRRFSG